MPLNGFQNHVLQASWSPLEGKGLSDHQQIMKEKMPMLLIIYHGFPSL